MTDPPKASANSRNRDDFPKNNTSAISTPNAKWGTQSTSKERSIPYCAKAGEMP